MEDHLHKKKVASPKACNLFNWYVFSKEMRAPLLLKDYSVTTP